MDIYTIEEAGAVEIRLYIWKLDGYVWLFDANDSTGQTLYSLYANTRNILWFAYPSHPFAEGVSWNGMCFNLANPDIQDLISLNPGLFNPILTTPASVYSVPGYNFQGITLDISTIAPHYHTWAAMQNACGLKLYTSAGHVIPLSFLKPITLTTFAGATNRFTNIQMCQAHGINPGLFNL